MRTVCHATNNNGSVRRSHLPDAPVQTGSPKFHACCPNVTQSETVPQRAQLRLSPKCRLVRRAPAASSVIAFWHPPSMGTLPPACLVPARCVPPQLPHAGPAGRGIGGTCPQQISHIVAIRIRVPALRALGDVSPQKPQVPLRRHEGYDPWQDIHTHQVQP